MSYLKQNALLAFIGYCIYDGKSGSFRHVMITETTSKKVLDFHGEFKPQQRHDPFKDYDNQVLLHYRSYYGRGSTFTYEGALQTPGRGSSYYQIKVNSNHNKDSRIIHGTKNNEDFEVEIESNGKYLILKDHTENRRGESFRFYLSDVY